MGRYPNQFLYLIETRQKIFVVPFVVNSAEGVVFLKTIKVFQALDEEERDLIQSIEKDEWTEVPDVERFKEQARRYAEATIRKKP